MAVLGLALVVEVRLLGSDVKAATWSNPQSARLQLLPLALTLALAGIFAGLVPGRNRDRPRGMAWLSVVWAGVAGVVIASTLAVAPYAVLLAMDAVRNAMTGPIALQPLRPNLHGRLIHAGVESAPVLACCLILPCWSRATSAAGPATPARRWRGPFALLAATAAAGLGAAWLYTVTIPMLDEWLTEGLRVTIDPLNAAVIVLGFAGLALGIAARATDRTGSPDSAGTEDSPRAWLWRTLRNLVIAFILLDFLAARGIDLIIGRRLADDEPVDAPLRHWIGWVDAALESILLFIRERVEPWYYFETPEWLALGALPWGGLPGGSSSCW